MKKFLPWLVGLLVIFAIYLYASPYLVLNNIKNAAQQGDADTLSGYIDFPSVKQSIKDQVKASIVEELTVSDEQDGFEALGTLLGAAMIDPLIDGLVTPDGIALMLQGQKLDFDLNNETSENKPVAKNADIDYKAGYLSFNRFKVQIIDADDADESLDVIMHRDGLSWKVTRIAFSLDSKSKKSNKKVEDSAGADSDWYEEQERIAAIEDDEFADIFYDTVDSEEVADMGDGNTTTDIFAEEGYYNGTDAYAVETTDALTPAQAAYIDYLVNNGMEVSQEMVDLLNDFTLDGGTDAELRRFIIERSGYDDGYDGLADCRNPDLTETQYINNCT